MAKQQAVGLQVDGLKDVQKALRTVDKALPRELRKANLAAAEIVAVEARRLAPRQSGRLQKSIKAQAGQREASVKVGTPARTPYAGPAIWGWGSKRNPRPQGGWQPRNLFPQKALANKHKQVSKAYEKAVKALTKRNL